MSVNFNLKPHPFLAHFIPGCFAAIVIAMAHYSWSMAKLNQTLGTSSGFALLVFIVGSLVLGECIDAARDILEDRFDKHCGEIDWNLLLHPEKKEESLYVFESYYFTYYVFCANLVLAIIVAIGGSLLDHFLPAQEWRPLVALAILAVMARIFFLDARSLRRDLVNKFKSGKK
jgi:predicted transporter